jgi:hypothetical protein
MGDGIITHLPHPPPLSTPALSITDLLSEGVWAGLDGRLVFAPVTAMTDETMLRSRQEMEAMRRNFVAGEGDNEDGEEAEEEVEEEVDTSIDTSMED